MNRSYNTKLHNLVFMDVCQAVAKRNGYDWAETWMNSENYNFKFQEALKESIKQHWAMITDLRDHLASLKKAVNDLRDTVVIRGVSHTPIRGTYLRSLPDENYNVRITFVEQLLLLGEDRTQKVPILANLPRIKFLNERFWEERYLEKVAKARLIVAGDLKPNHFQNMVKEISMGGNGSVYRSSSRKYITIPARFNYALDALEIICFPYVLFNSVQDAEDEANAWFEENTASCRNFLAPIFEMNMVTGTLCLVKEVNLSSATPIKRKAPYELASDLVKELKAEMGKAMSKRMKRMSLDELVEENANDSPSDMPELVEANEGASDSVAEGVKEKRNSVYGYAIEGKRRKRNWGEKEKI